MTDKTNAEGQEPKHFCTKNDCCASNLDNCKYPEICCIARVDELENTIEDLLKTKINLENELEFEKQVANSQVEITKEAQLEIEQVTSRVAELEGVIIESYETGRTDILLSEYSKAKAALSKPHM